MIFFFKRQRGLNRIRMPFFSMKKFLPYINMFDVFFEGRLIRKKWNLDHA